MDLKYAYEDPDRRGFYCLCPEEKANAIIVNKEEHTAFWEEFAEIQKRYDDLHNQKELEVIRNSAKELKQKYSEKSNEGRKILSEKKAKRDHYYALRETMIQMMKMRKEE